MKKTETQYCSTQKIPLTYTLSLIYYCHLATTTTIARKKIKKDVQEVDEKEEVRKERRKRKLF